MSNHFGILLLPCVEDEIFSLCEEHLFLFINLIVVKLCSTVRFSVDGHFHFFMWNVGELKKCFYYQSHFTCLRKQISHTIAEKKEFLL